MALITEEGSSEVRRARNHIIVAMSTTKHAAPREAEA